MKKKLSEWDLRFQIPMVSKSRRHKTSLVYLKNVLGIQSSEKLMIKSSLKGLGGDISYSREPTDTFWSNFDKALLEKVLMQKRINF